MSGPRSPTSALIRWKSAVPSTAKIQEPAPSNCSFEEGRCRHLCDSGRTTAVHQLAAVGRAILRPDFLLLKHLLLSASHTDDVQGLALALGNLGVLDVRSEDLLVRRAFGKLRANLGLQDEGLGLPVGLLALDVARLGDLCALALLELSANHFAEEIRPLLGLEVGPDLAHEGTAPRVFCGLLGGRACGLGCLRKVAKKGGVATKPLENVRTSQQAHCKTLHTTAKFHFQDASRTRRRFQDIGSMLRCYLRRTRSPMARSVRGMETTRRQAVTKTRQWSSFCSSTMPPRGWMGYCRASRNARSRLNFLRSFSRAFI